MALKLRSSDGYSYTDVCTQHGGGNDEVLALFHITTLVVEKHRESLMRVKQNSPSRTHTTFQDPGAPMSRVHKHICV